MTRRKRAPGRPNELGECERLSIYLPREQAKLLRRAAFTRDMTLSEYMRLIIETNNRLLEEPRPDPINCLKE